MRQAWMLTMAALVVTGTLSGAELVGVPGSTTSYTSEVEAAIGGNAVKMALTGTAMRTKIIVNVYAIGSYVQKGLKLNSAEELAGADVAKRLHLIMERTVDGKDMGEAFRSAIRMNYPEPTFTDEVNMLTKYMNSTSVRKGEHIYLTHVPGIGLHINVAGKADFMIRNVAFSKALWDIYLGPKNLGDAVKKGLTSRL